jgi:23S rRNA pseudouridine1911/1915/1917 synthase
MLSGYMNQGWLYQNQVTQVDVGMSVLDYYTCRYRHSRREEWQERIESGQIRVDGDRTTPDRMLQIGQTLTYQRPPWQEPDVPLAYKVLYEDSELLVVAKPAGLPVLPGGGFLEHTLLGQLQQRYPQETPFPIHRLGRGTSGLLLLARSPQARAHLSQQMRDRQIRKTYHALVGPGFPGHCTITQAIGKIPHPTLGYVYGAVPNGLPAYSECRLLHHTAESTLLEVMILTGRSHQIRIHLASVGFPLLGDPLYLPGGIPRQSPNSKGEKLPVPGDCGYSLHAYRLEFNHPQTGALLCIVCPDAERQKAEGGR